MKISIITVVYNGVDTVRDCVESVLGQTHADVEYIVVDGASTDGTVDLLRSYGQRIAHFISEPDRGLYDAMNKGLALATGEVVGFLNADDLYPHPDVLARVAATFERSGADGVYGDMLYMQRDDLTKLQRYFRSGPYRPGAFLWGWMPGHLSFFCKRWCYEQYGGFRLDLRTAADYELMLRFIHKHGIRLAYMDQVTIVMRAGGVSNRSLGSWLRANREDRQAWRLNGLQPYFFTLWVKPLRKIGQFFSKPPSVE